MQAAALFWFRKQNKYKVTIASTRPPSATFYLFFSSAGTGIQQP